MLIVLRMIPVLVLLIGTANAQPCYKEVQWTTSMRDELCAPIPEEDRGLCSWTLCKRPEVTGLTCSSPEYDPITQFLFSQSDYWCPDNSKEIIPSNQSMPPVCRLDNTQGTFPETGNNTYNCWLLRECQTTCSVSASIETTGDFYGDEICHYKIRKAYCDPSNFPTEEDASLQEDFDICENGGGCPPGGGSGGSQ